MHDYVITDTLYIQVQWMIVQLLIQKFYILNCSTGHIAIYELNIDRRTKPDRVRNIQDHAGSTVTALAWDAASSRVFAGDSIGKISIISISTNKVM